MKRQAERFLDESTALGLRRSESSHIGAQRGLETAVRLSPVFGKHSGKGKQIPEGDFWKKKQPTALNAEMTCAKAVLRQKLWQETP